MGSARVYHAQHGRVSIEVDARSARFESFLLLLFFLLLFVLLFLVQFIRLFSLPPFSYSSAFNEEHRTIEHRRPSSLLLGRRQLLLLIADRHRNIQQRKWQAGRSGRRSRRRVREDYMVMGRRYRPSAAVLLFFAFLLRHLQHVGAARSGSDAYHILGVASDASPDTIRKQYRQLCLQHHPDKNVHRSPSQRKASEEAFKRVQEAYGQVGNDESRRQYDARRMWSQSSSYVNNRDTAFEDLMNQYRSQQTRRSFYSVSPNMMGSFMSPSSLQSVFVQSVPIPLSTLYAGEKSIEFVLVDNVWMRTMAAMRGGCGGILLYQSLLYALPTLRFAHWLVAATLGATMFVVNLPRPTKKAFRCNLPPGYKAGTKLTFRTEDPSISVVFVLAEEQDSIYRRVGTDLHVDIEVDRVEARHGCHIDVPHIDPQKQPIRLAIPPMDEESDIVLRGHGWPSRSSQSTGDLIVHVHIKRTSRWKIPTG